MKFLKKISIIIQIIVAFLTAALTVIKISRENIICMDMLNLCLIVSAFSFLLMTLLVMYLFFSERISLLKKYIDNNATEADELIYFLHNIHENKRQHTLNCIKEGKILPDPKYFLDNEALRLHEKAQDDRKKIRDEISKQL